MPRHIEEHQRQRDRESSQRKNRSPMKKQQTIRMTQVHSITMGARRQWDKIHRC